MVPKPLASTLIVTFLLALGAVSAEITIELEGAGSSFSPGAETIDSNLTISYNEPIPKYSWLFIYIDNESLYRGQISLDRYLHEEDYYEYRNLTFGYNLTSNGTISWNEYPEQQFWYTVKVSGLCGGDWCNMSGLDFCECPCTLPGPPYPCEFSSTTGIRYDTVNGNPVETGLKFIYDLGDGGIPENKVNGSVKWEIQKAGATPPEVDLAMKVTCGKGEYGGRTVWEDGWVFQTISSPSNPCTEYVGGFDCRVMIMPFDDESMTRDFRRFGGPGLYSLPSGGVFKTKGPDVRVYQQRGVDVDWNGTTGEIIIRDFESDATYLAAYLPPNGPKVCAYTSYSVPASSTWSRTQYAETASAGYLEPYRRSYDLEELDSMTSLESPDCPIPPGQEHLCDKEDKTYDAVESYDPNNAVEMEGSFDGETLRVTADVFKKIISETESFTIDLSEFSIDISDMSEDTGQHTLRLEILEGDTIYKTELIDIFICEDADGDGYCSESGDCNDGNEYQNPGMAEACNGIDDDCNGIVDDGIAGMGELLGSPCNNWPGSVCKGSYVCNANGTGLVCKPGSGIYPGDLPEYCDNKLDDDCDTAIDEDEGFIIDGVAQPACEKGGALCVKGETRPCGVCRDGVSTCIEDHWGECVGDSEPEREVCNNIDDDCDGIVDNIFGKGSVEETRCGCYGGNPSGFERCNNIDDDCDGEVDEGINGCCTGGSTRTCGTDTGACEFGIETCEEGEWGSCKGAVQPKSEDICCNSLDDDCDGEVDELCSESDCATDSGDMTMLYYSMIGLGVIMLIGIIIYTQFIRKKTETA